MWLLFWETCTRLSHSIIISEHVWLHTFVFNSFKTELQSWHKTSALLGVGGCPLNSVSNGSLKCLSCSEGLAGKMSWSPWE